MKPKIVSNNMSNNMHSNTSIVSKSILFTIVAIILTSAVSAASFNLNSILQPFSGLNIGTFYLKYFAFIDAIVYFVLFLSLAQLVFTKVYKDNVKEAKMIGVAIGLALTVSMTVLEMKSGFNLGQLAPIALIIFLMVIAILLFNLLQGLFTGQNGKTVSAALTYLIVYGLLNVPFNVLSKWIEQNVPLLSAILALAAIVAFIYLIIELFKITGLGNNSNNNQQNIRQEQSTTRPETTTPTETTPITPSQTTPTTPNGVLPNNSIRPRPAGPRPEPTPRREHPGDPPTNVIPPPGIVPGPEPDIPFEPEHPVIPDDKEIFIDLSQQFNPIRSQGDLGACAAFASTAAFEYVLQSKENLSPLYDYYKIRELMGTISNDSGSTSSAMTTVLLNNGICFEKHWPYKISLFREQPPAITDIDAAQKKSANITRVDRSNPNQWVYALSNKHPLIIFVYCPKDIMHVKSFYHNSNPTNSGGHVMVIVGYHSHYPVTDNSGNTVGIKAFKVRNSWGVNWAENGYVWISAETLTKIMMCSPAIIKGYKSDNMQNHNFKITGRAVFDSEDRRIRPERTGYQIFSDDNWPNPIPNSEDPYYIGAMAQIKGALHGLGEIKVTDSKGRFSFEFSANPLEFEPLTELNKKFKQFNNINFRNLPAGIIIYKRHKENSNDKDWFFHIVDFKYSFGGRGGEGIRNENNPISSNNNTNINHSGIPITFNQNHTHEMNIIIPVADKLPTLNDRQ